MGTVAAGAAGLALQPVFSRNCFAAPSSQGADGLIHLNYNESAYGPSEKAAAAIRDAISSASRYFPNDYDELRGLLGKHHGLTADNIWMGAGSTEILKLCDDLFLRRARLVVAQPAYDAVVAYALNSRAVAVRVPLTADFRHDLARMAAEVTRDTGMVYLCNPNNPTGTIVTKDEMERFLNRVPESVPVVVDEAYSHFVASPDYESAVRYVKEGRKVVVARTFSKIYGLAGMRIGYAIAGKEIIQQLRPLSVQSAISTPAAHAARAALLDTEHVERAAKLNRVQLQTFYDEMKAAKFETIPSETNFAMVHIHRPVAPVIEAFAKRKILVGREFKPMSDYLRVTMGTAEEMKQFYEAFHRICGRDE
jgi:histidinol-phosphate aminotransferase